MGVDVLKVSVIVPVYNTERYLSSCLNSLVNQSLEDLEIIAVDDNSSDNSFEILKEYESRYPDKIKVLHNEKNCGQSFSRNLGISVAKGEYIGFLDSDDYVNFEMYKSMYEGAKENDFPEVVVTGVQFVKNDYYLDNNFSFLQRMRGSVYEVLRSPQNVLMESPSVCNKLFRKYIVIDDDFLNGKMWEDVAFSFSKMFNANRILRFNNPDYFYRRRIDSGVSSRGYNVNSHLLDIFDVVDKIEDETRKTGRFDVLMNEIKFVQITTCLQRVVEILEWPIPLADREKLSMDMCKIIISKYGDWRMFSTEAVSSKIGYMELEKLNDMMFASENVDTNESLDGLFEQVNSFIKMSQLLKFYRFFE